MKFLTIVIPALMLAACAGEPARTAATPEKAADKHCVRDTGSRIPSDGDCQNVSGRSYSREELERTGEPTAGGALGRVDPTVRR